MEFIQIVIYASMYLGIIATVFFILSFIAGSKKKILMYADDELPSVSIIIPAYNEEKSITKTIKSALAADYPKNKFEIIVIDDGSRDATFSLAKKLEGKNVRVFTKKNGGKGSALNLGLKKARGKIVFSMDADTFAAPESVKKMVRYFKNPEVMCVAPSMLIHNPKSFWQRIQQVEYLMGLFMRKAFASINSIYVTPGAFSAYRKSFFDKYGGYDEHNITEDLEVSLRIQAKGYRIENCPDAPVYTIAPSKFKPLMIQRRRWYYGLIKNMLNYRRLISPKYGDLGVFIIPVGWISIFFAVFVTAYSFINVIFQVRKELTFLRGINFDFVHAANVNFYAFERFLFLLFTNQILIFVLLTVCLLVFYLFYARKVVGRASGMLINIPLFFVFFASLFGFWWIVSILYAIFAKSIKWR